MAERGSFWQFTLDTYAGVGVQAGAIRLQNGRGADVNLLFYCSWMAVSGRGRVNWESIAAADVAIDEWRREVTLPLRVLRDRLKNEPALFAFPGCAEARAKVLAAEIESEQVAQNILEAQAPIMADLGRPEEQRVGDAAANLRIYLDFVGANLDEEDRTAIKMLLQASFPGAPESLLANEFRA